MPGHHPRGEGGGRRPLSKKRRVQAATPREAMSFQILILFNQLLKCISEGTKEKREEGRTSQCSRAVLSGSLLIFIKKDTFIACCPFVNVKVNIIEFEDIFWSSFLLRKLQCQFNCSISILGKTNINIKRDSNSHNYFSLRM